jgi:hypothetical protein
MIENIIINQNQTGSKAREITYPNAIITKTTINIRKNDFLLFFEIWSLKSIL